MFTTYDMETYCCFNNVWSLKIHRYVCVYMHRQKSLLCLQKEKFWLLTFSFSAC